MIHSCYTKSSGAWRVIDPGAGQACKSNEAALDLYSKSGAELAFLGKTQKAADSDKLDGLDSNAFLGASAKAADSSKLDGFGPTRYLRGIDADVFTDVGHLADGATATFGHVADGLYPGMLFHLTCDVDGSTTLVATSSQPFFWWWDDTFGNASPVGSNYEASFAIGNGVESHSVRAGVTNGSIRRRSI